jgi:serine/threonine protein kinase
MQRGHVDFPYDDWCQISDDAIDLIMGMMCKDTDQRMSAAEILSHPWIRMGGASSSGKQRANSEMLLKPSGGSARVSAGPFG